MAWLFSLVERRWSWVLPPGTSGKLQAPSSKQQAVDK